MLDEVFAEALVRLRGARSQRSVARKARVPTGTWCQWERGKRQPRKAQIAKICHGLDCTEEDIEATMWRIQAERFKLKGSEADDSTIEALSECQDQITSLRSTHLERLPADLRQMLTRLQVNVRGTAKRLKAVQADLEAMIVALGRKRGAPERPERRRSGR